jgi:uncharacterized protein (DUF2062 family)
LENISPFIWRRTPLGKYLRLIPRKKQLKSSWLYRKFGDKILCPDYWQMKKLPIAKGFAIGGFFAMMPMPWQMIPAGVMAIVLRSNIPLALLACWFTNPITHPFVIVFQLWLGETILHSPTSLQILRSDGVWAVVTHAPVPILTGAFICAVVWSSISFFLARFLYDLAVKMIVRSHEKRVNKVLLK